LTSNLFDKAMDIGASKTYSIADDVNLKSIKTDDKWGQFGEDWGFRIWDVPDEFRTDKKYENFILAKKEEEEKKLILESMPFEVDLEPTNICNLHCPLCSTGIGADTRQKGMMDFEKFKNLIDEIKDTVLQLSLQNWGESTLVPTFPKMIQYAAKAGIWMRVSSNFSVNYNEEYLTNLINSGLGKLVVDIDGTTQDIYEQYRVGGKLDTVLKNIEAAVKIKKENKLQYPIIQARMLVMKHNEHQIDEFKELSKKLDVDEIELGNIQLNPNTAAKKWLPENKDFIYKTYLDERRVTPCHWPWSGLVINWEGGVAPCTIVDDPNSDFGNVFTDGGVKKVWNSEFYVSARSEFSDEKQITKNTICNMCKNDTHNPALLRVGDSFSLTLNKDVKIREIK
jgi:radical SAM protein with 4Fe4S-binding SPASM domain